MEKSAQAMHKRKSAYAVSGNRFSTAYWENRVYRPIYTQDGERFEVAQFSVQIAHGGRRHTVGLATNTQDEAARRAVKLFKALHQQGWDAALNLFRPDSKPINKTLTLGRFLELVDEYAPMPRRTFANYAYAIRRIATDISGAKLKKGEKRFDPTGKWKQNADEIPLAKITAVDVEDWRTRFLKDHRQDHIAEQRAARSANSYLRNARALFSRRILDAMKKHGIKLPEPMPFAGVRLEGKTGSTIIAPRLTPDHFWPSRERN
jgi:hypothetical protein